MEKVRSGKKVLCIFIAVVMLLSSFPLSFVQAANQVTEDCTVCGGLGYLACTAPGCVNGKVKVDCTVCTGTGKVPEDCTACGGTGKIGVDDCTTCTGTGKVEVNCTACTDGKVEEDCTACNGLGMVECINCNHTGKVTNEYEVCPECHGNKNIQVNCTTCSGSGKKAGLCATCGGAGTVNTPVQCIECGGAGTIDYSVACITCGGSGKVDDVDCTACGGSGIVGSIETCTNCSGTGTVVNSTECTTCHGTGTQEENCPDCTDGKVSEPCARCGATGSIQTQNDDSFTFETIAPTAIKVGESLENKAESTKNTTGEVTYTSSDDSIASVAADGKVTAHKAGTVTITASIATDYTYSSKEITYDLTIDKGIPTVESYMVTPVDYQQTLAQSTFTSVSATDGLHAVAGTAAWKDTSIAPTVDDSNTTAYRAVFTPNDTDNYESVDFDAVLTVNPIDITGIEVTGATVTYDAQAHEALTVTGTQEGDVVEYSVNGTDYDTEVPMITNVSDCKPVHIKVTRNNNYNVYKTSVAPTMNPAAIGNVHFDTYNAAYDGAAHDAVVVTSGIINGTLPVDHYVYDGQNYDVCPQFTDVGEYDVTVVLSENYINGDVREVPVKAIITQKDVTIVTKDRDVEYNAAAYTAIPADAQEVTDYAEFSLATGDTLTSVEADGSFVNAGTHSINLKNAVIMKGDKNVTANYNISYQTGNLVIRQKAATVTLKDVDATYTALAHPAVNYDFETANDRFTVSGLVENSGHEVTLAFEGEATAVGTYANLLTATSCKVFEGETEVTNNYAITIENGKLTISYPTFDNYTYVKNEEDKGENNWYQMALTIKADDGYALCYENTDTTAFTQTLTYDTEGISQPAVAIKELATGYISDVVNRNEVRIDTVNPSTFDIEYSVALAYRVLETITFGFYQAPATVTLKAEDATSNIASITYKIADTDAVTVPVAEMTAAGDGFTYTTTVPAADEAFKGQITYSAKDVSGRVTAQADDKQGVITDKTAPVIDENKIEYVGTVNQVGDKYYYDNDAVVKFDIEEEYFFQNYYETLAELNAASNVVNALEKDVTLTIQKNVSAYGEDALYETVYSGSAGAASDLFSAQFDEANKKVIVTIPAVINGEKNDGDFLVTITYTDLADNSASATTKTLVIDTTKPVIEVTYEDDISAARKSEGFFRNRTATITVEERNFDKADFLAQITAKDINNTVKTDTAAQNALAANAWEDTGNTHVLTIPYTDDATYTFALNGLIDLAQRTYDVKAENEGSIYKKGTETPEAFTCDDAKPTDVVITYSDKHSVFDKIEDLIMWLFNTDSANTLDNGKCEVTLTTTDAISGLQYFTYSYVGNDEIVTENIPDKTVDKEKNWTQDTEDASKFTYTFEIPAQFRGKVEASATNNSGNVSNLTKDGKTIVVDSITPTISAEYSAPTNQKNGIDFYQNDVTVTVTVAEENFLVGEYAQTDDFKIHAVIADDNDAAIEEDYTITNWQRVNGSDTWQGSFVLSTEGDYTLTINYTDNAGNKATEYVKDHLTIDKTAPVIDISYDNNAVVNGKFFDAPRTATFTVVEHNFYPEDIECAFTAKNILGDTVAVEDYAAKLKDIANWTKSGNTYTIELAFTEDAIYTYSFGYADAAKNDAVITYVEGSKATNEFVVDTVAPEVTLSINESVIRKILNGITFGIFNKAVDAKVTITATDMTAGVETIRYASKSVGSDGIGSLAQQSVTANDFTVDESNPSEVKYTFTVAPQFRNALTSTVNDYSKNATSVDSDIQKIHNAFDSLDYDGVIKDTIPGTIEISVDQAEEYASKDTFATDFNYHVSVKDENAGIASVEVTLNGTTLTEDAQNTTIASNYDKEDLVDGFSFVINTSQVERNNQTGVYVLEVTLTDNAGNVSTDKYTAYIDVYAPKVTDFSFKSSGRAFVGDEAYEQGEKVDVVASDTPIYTYYFEKNTYVTVYVNDYEQQGFNKHTCGVEDIQLIATSNYGESVSCTPVDGSFVQTDEAIGRSAKTFLVKGPFKGNLYAIATDYAGNTPTNDEAKGLVDPTYKALFSQEFEGYVNPYDTVLEDATKHSETSSITIEPQGTPISTQNTVFSYKYEGDAQKDAQMDYKLKKAPLFGADTKVKLLVNDDYSGIKEISWAVMGRENQDAVHNQNGTVLVLNDGTLDGDKAGWKPVKDSNLVVSMEKTITVTNDSNDIVILVELTDRAGNKSYDYYVIGVDKTAPKITVDYNNNSASEGKYFKAPRTATITVVDRNFDDSLTNVIKNGSRLNLAWSKTPQADANVVCKATVDFSVDGDYTLSVNAKDRAQHECRDADVTYNGVAPKAFTIDLTDPVVTVTYQSTAQPHNENYYNAPRTATISVNEHNWNPDKFIFSLVMNDGKVTHPKLTWSNSGDTHTAKYTADSVKGDKYTLDFECKDRADNTAVFVQNGRRVKDYKAETFYVDQENPNISYLFNGQDTGDDTSATTNKEFSSKVNISDIYYDYVLITINGKARNYQKEIRSNATGVDIDEVIESISNDDKVRDNYYTITVNAYDKAGNSSKIMRYFAVNRNGSIFTLDQTATKLVEKKYTNTSKDFEALTIIEKNFDPVNVAKSVLKLSVGGKGVVTLESGKDYLVSGPGSRGEDGYYTVSYQLKPSVFEKDAFYKLLVTTQDAAGNTSKNYDKKGQDPNDEALPILAFTHDETAPIIQINLDENKKDRFYSIAAGEYVVKFTPVDTGAGIDYDSVSLRIGRGDKEQTILIGDKDYQFKFDKKTGEYSFVIKGNIYDVRLNYKDKAGNDFEELLFEHIAVSSNALQRFFYNTGLFVGVLVGIVAAATAVIILIAKRKKKEEAADTKAK